MCLMICGDEVARSSSPRLSQTNVTLTPAYLKAAVVSGLLANYGGPAFAVVTVSTLAMYASFTFAMVHWRDGIRKEQNAADQQAIPREQRTLMSGY